MAPGFKINVHVRGPVPSTAVPALNSCMWLNARVKEYIAKCKINTEQTRCKHEANVHEMLADFPSPVSCMCETCAFFRTCFFARVKHKHFMHTL